MSKTKSQTLIDEGICVSNAEARRIVHSGLFDKVMRKRKKIKREDLFPPGIPVDHDDYLYIDNGKLFRHEGIYATEIRKATREDYNKHAIVVE